MDSSVSPTHRDQEGATWNGLFDCTCYHPNFLFNQFGMLERCALRHGNVHSADGWREVLDPRHCALCEARTWRPVLPSRCRLRNPCDLRAAGRSRILVCHPACEPAWKTDPLWSAPLQVDRSGRLELTRAGFSKEEMPRRHRSHSAKSSPSILPVKPSMPFHGATTCRGI
jgi:hypothetical protein